MSWFLKRMSAIICIDCNHCSPSLSWWWIVNSAAVDVHYSAALLLHRVGDKTRLCIHFDDNGRITFGQFISIIILPEKILNINSFQVFM